MTFSNRCAVLRIRVVDFCPSRIQKQQQKSFCSHKYHKIKNYFISEQVKKKLWANLRIIIVLFTQKIVIKLSKLWVLDPGHEKTFSGSQTRGQKALDPGSGSATLQI
jgi:hypothetical protein